MVQIIIYWGINPTYSQTWNYHLFINGSWFCLWWFRVCGNWPNYM